MTIEEVDLVFDTDKRVFAYIRKQTHLGLRVPASEVRESIEGSGTRVKAALDTLLEKGLIAYDDIHAKGTRPMRYYYEAGAKKAWKDRLEDPPKEEKPAPAKKAQKQEEPKDKGIDNKELDDAVLNLLREETMKGNSTRVGILANEIGVTNFRIYSCLGRLIKRDLVDYRYGVFNNKRTSFYFALDTDDWESPE